MKHLSEFRKNTGFSSTPLEPNSTNIIEETEGDAIEDDALGHALVALNHIATIADDLYSVIGDEGEVLDQTDIDAVLQSYELLGEIYEKYEEKYDLPSEVLDDLDLDESFDELLDEDTGGDKKDATADKFKLLAQTGLVSKGDVSNITTALKNLKDDKPLSPAQRDIVSSTFVTLIGLVTGDQTVFSKIKQTVSK